MPRGFYWHQDSVRKVSWRFYGRRDPSSMVSRGFDGGWDNSTKLFCRNLHQTLETPYWKGRDVHKSAIKPSLHCRDVSKSLKAPVKFVEVGWSSSRSFNAVSYVSLWVWRPLWQAGLKRIWFSVKPNAVAMYVVLHSVCNTTTYVLLWPWMVNFKKLRSGGGGRRKSASLIGIRAEATGYCLE